MPAQGDIVLVPVPFTDLMSQKRRPVIVISHDQYHRAAGDFVGVSMTSRPVPGAYGFTISSADLTAGRLNRPGQVRADKIYTLAQSIIVHRIGRVHDRVLDRIRDLIRDLFSPKP